MLASALALFTDPLVELEVAEQFCQRRACLPGGDMHLSYARYQGACGSEVRHMRLASAKVDVQTLFVFPDPACEGAVFAAETVVLGRLAKVLVLDAPVLHGAQAAAQDPAAPARAGQFHQAMRSLASGHGLQNSEDIPDWYRDCRSGSDIFLRPETPARGQLLGAAFTACAYEAAALYRQHWQDQTRACDNPVAHRAAIAAYKHHHHENSPGVPIMSRCFGPEWTQAFMHLFFS